jgi:TPR repeat protein
LRKRFVTLLLAVVAARAPAGLRHIRAEAQGGNVAMQLQLGELYQYGIGLHDHDVPALAWYLVAAHAGNHEARARARVLAKTMPPQARAAARAKSVALLRRIKTKGQTAGVAPWPPDKPAK